MMYEMCSCFGPNTRKSAPSPSPKQEHISYIIFVRDDPAATWERIDINRKGFPQGVAGHDMGHHGVRQARQILIKNNGNADLSIDAVTAAYKEVISPESHPHHHH